MTTNPLDGFLSHIIWGDDCGLTGYYDTYLISGLYLEKGPGDYDVVVSAGNWKIAGTNYVYNGGTISFLEGNTFVWADSSGIQQGTIVPEEVVLLGKVITSGTSITSIDIYPAHSLWQKAVNLSSNLSSNTGVSFEDVGSVDYLSNNIIQDNNSLKEAIESLDVALGDIIIEDKEVIKDTSITITAMIEDLDIGFKTLRGSQGAGLIGVQDAQNKFLATTVEGALQEGISIINNHIDSLSEHGVSGNIVGTSGAQSLSNKTLISPVISNFQNAQHDHMDTSHGGTLISSSITDFSIKVKDIVTSFVEDSDTIDTSIIDNKMRLEVLPQAINHNVLYNYDLNRHLLQSQMSLANLGIKMHSNLTHVGPDDHHPRYHSIASHSDTTATGAQLNTLTNGSNSDSLHKHSATELTNISSVVVSSVGGSLLDTGSIDFTVSSGNISAIVKENGVDHNLLYNYDSNRHLLPSQISLSSLGVKRHSDLTNIGPDDHHPRYHSIASHSDTTATGVQLNTLTNGSNSDSLHTHAANGLTGFLSEIGNILSSAVTNNIEEDIEVTFSNGKLNFEVSDNFLRNDENTTTNFNITARDVKVKNAIVLEDPGDGLNTVTLRAPTGFSNYAMTLPATVGQQNQILSIDNINNLIWVDGFNPNVPGAIGGLTPGSGNFTTVTANTNVRLKGGTEYITVRAQSDTASYTLDMPKFLGNNGDILALDANRKSTWIPVSDFLNAAIMTSPGDIIYRNSSNNTARLGVGPIGTVLKVTDSGIISWSKSRVRNSLDSQRIRVIADKPGISVSRSDGRVDITNDAGAQIYRIEVDINAQNDELDSSGNFVIRFSSSSNNIGANTFPTAHVIDRSNAPYDGADPTEANPYIQLSCDESTINGIRARIISQDSIKFYNLTGNIDYGTLILQF
jgi:hypothetical protein